ncbi:MAG: ATP-binding protein, partial [Pseudomonadota bacterium]
MTETQPYEQFDRRVSVRRKEDYFWLKRLADLTGEICLAVNRDLLFEYIDEKVFGFLGLPIPVERLNHLNDLTRIMAEQGYFGRGQPGVFEALIADMFVNQRLKQAAATQIINAVTPTGQHIDIRVSLGRDDGYLILMRDTTQEELERRVLNTALEIGEAGFWSYNLRTREYSIRADALRPFFKPETFERYEREGFSDAEHPDDKKRVQEVLREVRESMTPRHITTRMICDMGPTRHIRSHIMPNVDESGRVRSLTCFFTDITQQVNNERELKDARREAEQALGAKNEFLGRLSHEVRTPLNAVIGMADALVHNCPSEEIKPQLVLIQNSAEKVMEMVDGTLEHTKLSDEAVELNERICAPRDVVESVCRKWEPRAQSNNVALSWTFHPDVPDTVEFDDYRYEQCLSNLLSNAIKFTQGGKVQVLLAPSGDGDRRKLVLAVRDNGIGMTDEAMAQIFKPFRQADRSISSRFGGTGLGLSIVKDLVELMGGRINVTSTFGKGTLFAIAIPYDKLGFAQPTSAEPVQEHRPAPEAVRAEPAPSIPAAPATSTVMPQPVLEKVAAVDPVPATEPTQAEPAPSVDEPFKSLRVLIVDDNATNHIVASSLLSKVVGEIDTALNGQEALKKLADKPFDLVLMDIHMPVMDGIETTLAIRGEPSPFQNIPIIALTADPQYQQARLCRNIGMNSSLGKPVKLAGLMQAFEEVLLKNDATGIQKRLEETVLPGLGDT